MIIQLDKAISDLKAEEDVKTLLRQIVAAINALDEGRSNVSSDIVFKDTTKGVVGQGTDGNYYRATIVTSGETPSWSFEKVAKKL